MTRPRKKIGNTKRSEKSAAPLRHSGLGVSLVEFSVILIVIAFLVVAAVQIKDMLRKTEAKAVIGEVHNYSSVIENFLTKYHYFPGDIPNPTNFGLSPGGGNGNRVVENLDTAGHGLGFTEQDQFWVHLKDAGLMDQSVVPPALNTSAFPGQNRPSSKAVTEGAFTFLNQINPPWGTYFNVLRLGGTEEIIGSPPTNSLSSGRMTTDEIFYIDKVTDDGSVDSSGYFTGGDRGNIVVDSDPTALAMSDVGAAGFPYWVYNTADVPGTLNKVLFQSSGGNGPGGGGSGSTGAGSGTSSGTAGSSGSSGSSSGVVGGSTASGGVLGSSSSSSGGTTSTSGGHTTSTSGGTTSTSGGTTSTSGGTTSTSGGTTSTSGGASKGVRPSSSSSSGVMSTSSGHTTSTSSGSTSGGSTTGSTSSSTGGSTTGSTSGGATSSGGSSTGGSSSGASGCVCCGDGMCAAGSVCLKSDGTPVAPPDQNGTTETGTCQDPTTGAAASCDLGCPCDNAAGCAPGDLCVNLCPNTTQFNSGALGNFCRTPPIYPGTPGSCPSGSSAGGGMGGGGKGGCGECEIVVFDPSAGYYGAEVCAGPSGPNKQPGDGDDIGCPPLPPYCCNPFAPPQGPQASSAGGGMFGGGIP